MMIRLFLFSLLLGTANAGAAERFLVNFELVRSDVPVESGKAIASAKPYTWNKGLQRSYLKLRCRPQESGRMQKLYSTVDQFAGLRVTHQVIGDKLELKVIHDDVQPRLAEIRALSKDQCQDLSPVVTVTTETYHFPARDGLKDSRAFGADMSFRVDLQEIGGTR